MTWFIDKRRFPDIAYVHVGSYSGGSLMKPPPPNPRQREPFTAEVKAAFPKAATVVPRPDGFKVHIIKAPTYFLLSGAAVDVLRNLQPDGWDAVPIEIALYENNKAETFIGKTYFLFNLYLHRNFIDLDRSDIRPEKLHAGSIAERTVYWLRDQRHRQIAIKRNLIGEVCLWLGEDPVLNHTIFVADRLKEAWCGIGMNPAVFERCLDVQTN